MHLPEICSRPSGVCEQKGSMAGWEKLQPLPLLLPVPILKYSAVRVNLQWQSLRIILAGRMLSRLVISDSSQPHGLQPTRFLCPWSFPGKNTGVGCHFPLQGIFLTNRLNPCLLSLLYWWVDSLPLSYQGSSCRRNSWSVHFWNSCFYTVWGETESWRLQTTYGAARAQFKSSQALLTGRQRVRTVFPWLMWPEDDFSLMCASVHACGCLCVYLCTCACVWVWWLSLSVRRPEPLAPAEPAQSRCRKKRLPRSGRWSPCPQTLTDLPGMCELGKGAHSFCRSFYTSLGSHISPLWPEPLGLGAGLLWQVQTTGSRLHGLEERRSWWIGQLRHADPSQGPSRSELRATGPGNALFTGAFALHVCQGDVGFPFLIFLGHKTSYRKSSLIFLYSNTIFS